MTPSAATSTQAAAAAHARHLAQFEALGRVAHVLAGAEDAARTMEFVAAEGMRVFGAERAGVFVFDRTTGRVECRVARGLPARYIEALKLHFNELPSAQHVMRGAPYFSPDARADEGSPMREEAAATGIAAVAALPLVYAGEIIGSLAFYHDAPRVYPEEERRLAIAFADQAALAIGKSRLVDQITRIKQEWQSAFDGIGSGLAIVDPRGTIVRANRFVADITGVGVTALPGLSLRTLFTDWPPAERDPLLQALKLSARVSVFLDGKNGRHFVLAATPHADGGLVVAIDDLTELVRLEERFTRVVETANDAIVLSGTEGRVTFVNPAALDLFGRGKGALLGRRLAELIPEGAGARGGGRRTYQSRILRPDGERLLAVSVAPLEERGGLTGSVAVVRDVTDEQHAAGLLRRSEERYRKLFARAPLAIFTVDPTGRFHSVNRAALQMAGLSQPDPERRLRDFLLPAEAESMEAELARSFRGETRDFMFHFRRLDGAVRLAAAVTVPIEEATGAAAVLAIARDVTEESALRERLTHSEKMAALGSLVSGVAHELNNPLAGIAALAQSLLFDPTVDSATVEVLDTVRREAVRAGRIVSDLLVFARLRPLVRSELDLNGVVREVFAASPHLSDGAVEWDLLLSPGLPAVSGDRDQIRQVVTNLLVNAAQAMRLAPVRRGQVRTWLADELVGCEVGDSGPGIAPEVMPRIFEPFYTTKGVGEGTGLGLSISHGIVRAHGGEIYAQNRPEGGARVWFALPRDITRAARIADG